MRQPTKFVTAIVRPFKIGEILEALTRAGVQSLIVTEVKGYGQNRGYTELYRGTEFIVKFASMLKLEVALQSDQVEKVTEAILQAARTGHSGDGKIFVSDLDYSVRIPTGETDAMPPRKAA
jgi:nitrogen regulatory protein P-II 2